MTSAALQEAAMVFAIATGHDDNPVLCLGLPEAGWEYIKDGKTQTLALAQYGLPLTVFLWGGKDRADVLRPLQATRDQQTQDVTRQFSGTTNSLCLAVLHELQDCLPNFAKWTPAEAARLAGKVALVIARMNQDPTSGK